MTSEEILQQLIEQLQAKLELRGYSRGTITERINQLKEVVTDYHLPNQPDDVLQGFIDAFDY